MKQVLHWRDDGPIIVDAYQLGIGNSCALAPITSTADYSHPNEPPFLSPWMH